MSTRAFCVARRQAEYKAFINVIRAVPQSKRDYRPDPKARTAGELAWLLAVEERALLGLLDAGVYEWNDVPTPATMDEITVEYEQNFAHVTARLERLDDAGWSRKVKLIMGGAGWEDSLSAMMWGCLFDSIHHRGQLTTYLRPMGSKVPAIYGPSADSAD